MTRCCPTCRQPLPEQPRDRTDEIAEQLRQWCTSNGVLILAGDRVNESDAARILGRQPATLRNWRSAGAPLPSIRVRGRATYQLLDLARFLATGAD